MMKIPAYAVGMLREVRMGDQIAEYLRRIDATLAPHQGRFLIHGGAPTVLEGSWSIDLIVIEFPDFERATQWYHSADYQDIIGLRSGASLSTVALVRGVPGNHRATDLLP